MRIAIIMLNWNNSTETVACVSEIHQWSSSPELIYIVDNGSSPEHVNAINNLPGTVTIHNDVNRGYSGGNNIGIEMAISDGFEAVLLLNNDARIEEADFHRLMQTMEKDDSVVVAGPLIYDISGQQLQNAGGRDIGFHYFSHYPAPLDSANIYDVDYVSGTCALFRLSVLKEVGLMDEDYFFSGEIADLCKRIKDWDGNLRIVVNPKTRALHDLTVSSDNRATLYTYYTVRNRYLYIRKHLSKSAVYLVPYWIYKHLKHAFQALRMNQKDSAQLILVGVYHGLKGRYGGFTGQES